MQGLDDMALLREYARSDSEAAFEKLVSHHVHWVHSAALRQVRDPLLAEEVTQAVFTILAQKAGRLGEETILSGWLFKTTRFVALAQSRTAARRRQYEQKSHLPMEVPSPPPDPLWDKISPQLDEALAQLGDQDRQAILLRFFEDKSLAEVSRSLGTGEDAARMRINRALEKLHRYFSKRGISSTTTMLTGAFLTNSVQAAPVALVKIISAAASLKGAAAGGSTLTLAKGALKLMAWTKAKTAAVVSVWVLLAVGATTVAVKEIQAHQIYPWQVETWHRNVLDQAPPQVAILTANHPGVSGGWGISNGKVMGMGATFKHVIQAAWCLIHNQSYDDARTIALTPLPVGRFDFIASRPGGNGAAFQQEIKRKFGVEIRLAVVPVDCLLLTAKASNRPGLRINTSPLGERFLKPGNWKVVNQPLASLALNLEWQFQVPVIDCTGLGGNYDFELKWNEMDFKHPDPEPLKQAVLDQLGLELVPTNLPIQCLVVEKTN